MHENDHTFALALCFYRSQLYFILMPFVSKAESMKYKLFNYLNDQTNTDHQTNANKTSKYSRILLSRQ